MSCCWQSSARASALRARASVSSICTCMVPLASSRRFSTAATKTSRSSRALAFLATSRLSSE
eukprot:4609144-Heterocapsa_arctica.AAC.1